MLPLLSEREAGQLCTNAGRQRERLKGGDEYRNSSVRRIYILRREKVDSPAAHPGPADPDRPVSRGFLHHGRRFDPGLGPRRRRRSAAAALFGAQMAAVPISSAGICGREPAQPHPLPGVVLRRVLRISAEDAASVEMERTPLLWLLGGRRIRVNTAGLRRKSDAVLYLSAAQAKKPDGQRGRTCGGKTATPPVSGRF